MAEARNPETWLFGPDHDWRHNAACSRLSPEEADDFFPVEGEPHRPHAIARAKRVCAECPVVPECRAWIDSFEAQSPRGDPTYFGQIGIWAGETPEDRSARRRGRRLVSVSAEPTRGTDGRFASRWSSP
jgi:transcription factor WhiB